ncbi:hypothetical protein [Eubacterium aggregans]|uniref:hypothetical protein n=1 Tax=Eubacterium aggregans TaxID=81409 RepID=UPI003F2D95A5
MENLERTQLLQRLNDAQNYFDKKQDLYDALVINNQSIESFEMSLKKPTDSSAIVVTIVLSFVFMLFLSFIANIVGVLYGSGTSFLSDVAIILPLVIVFVVIKAVNDGDKTKKAGYREKINLCKNQNEETMVELSDYYNAYLDKILPIEYSVPSMIEILKEYVKTYRADSVKEAINLYFDEEHKSRMEDKQKQILRATQSVAGGAKATAGFAGAMTAVSIIRLFSGR